MSYRSDVMIAIPKEAFYTMINNACYNVDVLDFLHEGAESDYLTHKDYKILHWEDVEWNNSYEEVAFVNKQLKQIKYYDFVRIGEDYNDTEVIYQSELYLIGVRRALQVNLLF